MLRDVGKVYFENLQKAEVKAKHVRLKRSHHTFMQQDDIGRVGNNQLYCGGGLKKVFVMGRIEEKHEELELEEKLGEWILI